MSVLCSSIEVHKYLEELAGYERFRWQSRIELCRLQAVVGARSSVGDFGSLVGSLWNTVHRAGARSVMEPMFEGMVGAGGKVIALGGQRNHRRGA